MIAQPYLEEWRAKANWRTNEQVEQDLIISRAIVEIFSDDLLRNTMVFRGGTALHKLYLYPQPRYSEDIDLVQINAEPIKGTMDRIREVLSFLGEPKIKQKAHNNTLIFRVESEIPPIIPIRLKVEINTREHLNILGLKEIPFEVDSTWFSEKCNVTCYTTEELLSTKLKALYGRKKGRDLFDLFWALTHLDIDTEKLLHCCKIHYEHAELKPPTIKQFLLNMEEKLADSEFTNDIFTVLKPNIEYDNLTAYELVRRKLIEI